jgi:hypothetical protein
MINNNAFGAQACVNFNGSLKMAGKVNKFLISWDIFPEKALLTEILILSSYSNLVSLSLQGRKHHHKNPEIVILIFKHIYPL